MAYLTAKATVCTDCNFPSSLADKIEGHILDASLLLTSWIGATKYAALIAAGSGDEYGRAKKAESLLTGYAVMPMLNLRITDKGGFIISTGAPAVDSRDLMTKSELNQYKKDYINRAYALVSDLVIHPFDADDEDEIPHTFFGSDFSIGIY